MGIKPLLAGRGQGTQLDQCPAVHCVQTHCCTGSPTALRVCERAGMSPWISVCTFLGVWAPHCRAGLVVWWRILFDLSREAVPLPLHLHRPGWKEWLSWQVLGCRDGRGHHPSHRPGQPIPSRFALEVQPVGPPEGGLGEGPVLGVASPP